MRTSRFLSALVLPITLVHGTGYKLFASKGCVGNAVYDSPGNNCDYNCHLPDYRSVLVYNYTPGNDIRVPIANQDCGGATLKPGYPTNGCFDNYPGSDEKTNALIVDC